MAGLWPEIRAALNGEFWVPAGSILTVTGTAAPSDVGFQADLARALDQVAEGMWVWLQCHYPAATFPMRPSVLIGMQNLVDLINRTPGALVLCGYSQGALVVCAVWRDLILNPAGALHHRLNDVVAVVPYGNPMRAPGVAYGNELAGQPAPGKDDGHTTGGIAGPANLKPQECVFPAGHPMAGKPAVLDFANEGDLYASAPVGDRPWESETEVGALETMIYEAVQDFNGDDIMAFAKTLFKLATALMGPIFGWLAFLPLVQAIWNGLMFLGQGPRAPHWTYDVGPATRYLVEIGNRIRTA